MKKALLIRSILLLLVLSVFAGVFAGCGEKTDETPIATTGKPNDIADGNLYDENGYLKDGLDGVNFADANGSTPMTLLGCQILKDHYHVSEEATDPLSKALYERESNV